jgi:hypothetical protein
VCALRSIRVTYNAVLPPVCTYRLSRGLFGDLQRYAQAPFVSRLDGRAYRLKVSLTMDMKQLQLMSGLGAGSFVGSHICTYCDVRGPTKQLPALERCAFCTRTDTLQRFACYHHAVIGSAEVGLCCAVASGSLVLRILLDPPAKDAPVAAWRAYVADRLGQSTMGPTGRALTAAQIQKQSDDWWAVNCVNGGNIDDVEDAVIARQLSGRLPTEAHVQAFWQFDAARRAVIEEQGFAAQPAPRPDASSSEGRRALLRKVLVCASRLAAARRILALDWAPAITALEICPPDVLHCFMRVVEKVFSGLFTRGIQARAPLPQGHNTKLSLKSSVEHAMNLLLVQQPHAAVVTPHSVDIGNVCGTEAIKFSMPGGKLRRLAAGAHQLVDVLWPGSLQEMLNRAASEAAGADAVAPQESIDEAVTMHTSDSVNSGPASVDAPALDTDAAVEAFLAAELEVLTVDAGTPPIVDPFEVPLRWYRLFYLMNRAFASIDSCTDTSLATVDTVQKRIDSFLRLYVEMFGGADITNYLHVLQAGHMHSFLCKYGCLKCRSNASFEAAVGTTKTYYHRSTQKGGHAGVNQTFTTVQAMERRLGNDVLLKIGKMAGNARDYLGKLWVYGKDLVKGMLTQTGPVAQ